jgi:pyridinium-3,5-biscarboxylic acid mononucleotide synthase
MAPRKAPRRRQDLSRFACLDLGRETRTGVPEVVIAEGKQRAHLIAIAKRMLQDKGRVIITRVPDGMMGALKIKGFVCQAHRDARICVLKKKGYKVPSTGGLIAILAAGTSDYPVAEEARIVAQELGCEVKSIYDIGVAGVHRLYNALDGLDLDDIDAFIVIAGREGALPTLVSGLVDVPVIGVPVSTGYGKGGRGEAALLAMLQSCSPLVVVNIDAGFIAGVVAARIANRRVRKPSKRTSKGPKPGQKRQNR